MQVNNSSLYKHKATEPNMNIKHKIPKIHKFYFTSNFVCITFYEKCHKNVYNKNQSFWLCWFMIVFFVWIKQTES